MKDRLNQATDCLAVLGERRLAAQAPGAGRRWPGRTLRLADGTGVSKPGGTGPDWRVHRGVAPLDLTDQHGAEALERGAPNPGEIRLGDRNHARAPGLRRFRAQSGGPADFIVRLRWNARPLSHPAGRPFDRIGDLPCLPPGSSPHEGNLRATAGRDEPALAVRLIVPRPTPEATEVTRLALRRAAARTGKALDPRSRSAAAFMILATSLPQSGYRAKAVLAASRLRRQIERAFQPRKSLRHIDHLPTRTERGSPSWLPAHLIPARLGDDLSASWTLPP